MPYYCEICKKVLKSKRSLDAHIAKVHGENEAADAQNDQPGKNEAADAQKSSPAETLELELEKDESGGDASYECADCGTAVTPGQNECPGCGEKLMWGV